MDEEDNKEKKWYDWSLLLAEDDDDYDNDDDNYDDDNAMSYSRNGGACDARALCKRAVKYDVTSMQVGGQEVKWAFLYRCHANR